MKKDNLILLATGLAAVGLFLYLKKRKNGTTSKNGTPEIPIFPLKLDSQGFEVKVVQTYLNTTCKSQLAISGVYDKITEETSRKCMGTPKTGIVDEKSYKRIFRDLNNSNLLPKR